MNFFTFNDIQLYLKFLKENINQRLLINKSDPQKLQQHPNPRTKTLLLNTQVENGIIFLLFNLIISQVIFLKWNDKILILVLFY
jgi:hypothetical protein